jgi:uncharacterized membrane protein YgcG
MKKFAVIATIIALAGGVAPVSAQSENSTAAIQSVKSAIASIGEDKEKILEAISKAVQANPDQVASIVVAAIEAVVESQFFGGDAAFIALIVEVAVKEVPQAAATITEAAVAKATTAAIVSAIVEGAVKAAPDSAPAITTAAVNAVTNTDFVPVVVEAAVTSAPQSAALTVEAAIKAAPQSLGPIVEAAVTAAPESSAVITEAANAAAPESAAIIQTAASNAQAAMVPNPINFPGEDPLGRVSDKGTQDGASGDEGFGGGGKGDGGFSGGGGGGSVIVFPPVIPPDVTSTNPK